MDAKHKDRIVELEAKEPETPPEERKARVAELQGYATTIALHLAETRKLMDNTTTTWTTMEDLDDLVEVCAALQKNQKELDEVMTIMKYLVSLQHMLKMGESKSLQTELQQLQAQEAEYLKTLQPWKDQVSKIVVKVNAKLTKFQAMQMTVASLLAEPTTAYLVNKTRKCVDQMTQDITGLQDTYTQFSTKLWETVKGKKDDAGGSRQATNECQGPRTD